MPRTVDSIVSCHMAAVALRRVGKPIWAVSIRLKEVLAQYASAGDDLTAEQAVEMGQRIGGLLNSRVPAGWRLPEHENYSMDFEDLIQRFEQASVSDFTPSPEWPETPCEVMNSWLDELYDWGDRYRVCLG